MTLDSAAILPVGVGKNYQSPFHTTLRSDKLKKWLLKSRKISIDVLQSIGYLQYFVIFFCIFMGFRLIFTMGETSPGYVCPFPDNVCKTFKLYLPYNKTCSTRIVESIPENITFNSNFKLQSTYDAWSDLINEANKTIDLAVFYWSLNGSDVSSKEFNSSWEGEEILKMLINAGSKRNISIRIIQNAPDQNMQQTDSKILKYKANAEVLSINFTDLIGAGILHTKMWIVDETHVYIGSANMDWRSLTQVKELGIILKNCPAVARDATKIFEIYKYAAKNKFIPPRWPFVLSADSNIKSPFHLTNSESNFSAFLSSSPPQFNAEWRTNDIAAIQYNIYSAEKFVYVAVMDYFPVFLYSPDKKYYSCFDEALRKAAYENTVVVRVLASHWNHTRTDMVYWLKSLRDMSHENVTIEVKLFVVPIDSNEQREIPFARVNHNKYMVTDKTAYIDTSNWSGDYFTSTGGVGISITPDEGYNNTIRDDLQLVFERDWNSAYAHEIDEFIGLS